MFSCKKNKSTDAGYKRVDNNITILSLTTINNSINNNTNLV